MSRPADHDSPFHAGEQAVQARAGVRERIERVGRKAIRDSMPDQHRELFAALPFVAVGALDDRQRPWASVLVGTPGFMSSPDPKTLHIAARPARGDPLGSSLVAGAPVGLLGIQPETRRRNRMNGTVIERGRTRVRRRASRRASATARSTSRRASPSPSRPRPAPARPGRRARA